MRVGQILFALGSFIPGAGIVTITGNLMALAESSSRRSFSEIRYEAFLPAALGILFVALFQIAMGIVVAVTASKRPDLTPRAKMGWTLGCLFVGSIVLPLYFFSVVRVDPRA